MVKVELTLVRAQETLARLYLSAGQVLRARVVSVGEDEVELELPGFRLMARSLVPLPLGRLVTLLVKESSAERVVLQWQEEAGAKPSGAAKADEAGHLRSVAGEIDGFARPDDAGTLQTVDPRQGAGVRQAVDARQAGDVRQDHPRAGATPHNLSPAGEGWEGVPAGGATRENTPHPVVPAGAWLAYIPGGREERPFQVRMRKSRGGFDSARVEVSLFLEVETPRLDVVGIHLAARGPRLGVHFQVASQPVRELLEGRLGGLAAALEALEYEIGGLSCAVRTSPGGRVGKPPGGLDTRV